MPRFAGLIAMLLAAGIAWGGPGASQKDEVEFAGTIKSVDTKAKQFVITLADKSDRGFLVNKATKFFGPRGAEHEDGLHDEAMTKGSSVRVVPATDEKFAKVVKLSEPKKGKKTP